MSGVIAGLCLLVSLNGAWETNGPHGGFVLGVTADGDGMPVAYAVPHGLYRYLGGNEWERLGGNTPVPFLEDGNDPLINDLEFINGRFWVCTPSSGLWSFDETVQVWERAPGIPGNNIIGIGFAGDSLVVATPSNVWLSEDNGVNFGPFPDINLPSDIDIIDIAVNSPGFEIALPALTTDGQKLFVRNSVGTTYDHDPPNWGLITCLEWRQVPDSDELSVVIGTNTHIYQAFNPQGNNPNWNIWTIWETDAQVYAVYVLDDNTQMFAALEASGIWYDEHGFGTWQKISDGLRSQIVFDLAGDGGSVYAGGADGLYTEETLKWTMAPRMPAQNFYDIDIDHDDPMHVFCTPIGSGVAETENAGDNWRRIGIDSIPFANCMATGNDGFDPVLFAGDFLINRIAYSRDEGESWVIADSIPVPGKPIHVVCDPDDATSAWWIFTHTEDQVTYYDLVYNEDFFNTLKPVFSLGSDEIFDFEYCPADNILYYIAENGKTFRIDNLPEPISVEDAADEGIPPSSVVVQIEVSAEGLYALTDNNSIYFSSDHAESWTRIEGISGAERIAASPGVPGGLIAVLPALSEPGYEVAFTADGGGNWLHLEGVVPGILQYCEMAAEDTVAQAYVATEKGVFHQEFYLTTVPVGDTLNISITAETRQFRPEIEEVAEFRLEGEKIETLNNWELQIETIDGDTIYTERGFEPPPLTLTWDGYTSDGWMWGEDEYRAIFTGRNPAGEVAVDTTDELVVLVLGTPPMSTMREATFGPRLLIEDPQDTDHAQLIYRSRKPGEMFSVDYSIGSAEFMYGMLLSDSKDENTVISSIAAKESDALWTCWVDVYVDQDEIRYPTLYAMVETPEEYIWYEIISFEDVKVDQALIGLTLNNDPVLAMVSNNASLSIGDLYLYHSSTDSWGHETIFYSQMDTPVEDLELVAASDGLHIIYLAAGMLHDVIWSGEGVELDTTIDPRIEGVTDFSATSYSGDVINLTYTNGGDLFYLEYSGGSWGTAPEEVPASPPSGYNNLTCNINAGNTFTAAWESAASIYYIQRRQGEWSNEEHQTPAGSAFHPQMSMRTYKAEQPLIAWTEGTELPYRINLVQLGDEPVVEDSIELEIFAPDEVLVGDPLEVSVISVNGLVDTIEVVVFGDDFEFEARPTHLELYPADSTSFDSLYARFDSTMEFPLGFYRLEAYARSEGMERIAEHFFEVQEPPEEVLLDPANVFFVPSPAINQQIGRIYYDLYYEADIYISIFTARGRQILYYEEQRASPGFGEFYEVDISNLGADVYFFVLEVDADPDDDEQPYDPDMPSGIETYMSVTKPFVVVR